MSKELLRNIPRVDELATASYDYYQKHAEKVCLEISQAGPSLFVPFSRNVLDKIRKEILEGAVNEVPDMNMLAELVCREYASACGCGLKKVINATGITLHTNMGRAPMGENAARAAYNAAISYTDLEYDLKNGERGSRYAHVEGLITEMTGTEAALVVNNNAAAVMLILHALGYGKNMIISRGELIEIGGSFRLPSVMEVSGVALKEVGCTNKTHPSDYIEAIDDNTAAILKANTSNYIIEGFTESVSVSKLKSIGESHNIPVIYDLGSADMEQFESDADIICFSGDKLLGGPQSGIICGRKKYIDIIKRDDLNRTLRPDKMTIAALGETLKDRLYRKIPCPVESMLNMSIEEMERKADDFINRCSICFNESGLKDGDVTVERLYTETETGGGSRPGVKMNELCIAISAGNISATQLNTALRLNEGIPIIGRIKDDKYLISMRTVEEKDFECIMGALVNIIMNNGLHNMAKVNII